MLPELVATRLPHRRSHPCERCAASVRPRNSSFNWVLLHKQKILSFKFQFLRKRHQVQVSGEYKCSDAAVEAQASARKWVNVTRGFTIIAQCSRLSPCGSR